MGLADINQAITNSKYYVKPWQAIRYADRLCGGASEMGDWRVAHHHLFLTILFQSLLDLTQSLFKR